ncbi:MAG: hypothetical protein AAF125_22415, partial [Chloroflexota bacterium]
MTRQTHILLAVFAALFAVSAALYVFVYAVPFPMREQYVTSFIVASSVQDGTFGLQDLGLRFLEHRLVPSHLTTAILTPLTGWNIRIEAFVAFVALVGYSALIIERL